MTGTLIWYWGRLGGGPQMTELLLRYLADRGHGSSIALSLSAQNERRRAFEALSARAHFVDTFASSPDILHLARLLPGLRRHFRAVIAETEPRTIIIPMLFGALVPLLDIALGGGRRIVYVMHDLYAHPGDRHALGQGLTQRAMFRFADEIVTVSDTLARVACQDFPRLRGRVATEPLAGLFAAASAPRARPSGPIRFLMPGRLVRYKGYERLAAALSRVRRDDFTVRISGDGPYRTQVRQLFRADPRVTIDLRWRSPEENAAQYREHDAVLCPYDEASQSAVVCEAMAAGLPCIVTPVGALPEQLGFGAAGIVLRDLSPAALAGAMTSIVAGDYDYAVASGGALARIRADRESLTWARLVAP